MEAEASPLHVEFPDFSCSILKKLNRQRQLGQLCDITVVIQGHRFRAHRAVLAASSPYFCDQVLLKNSVRVVLPDVMLPRVFESLLLSCYTGTLLLPAGEVVAFLTAASFLQMWHVVDKCTELLEGNSAAPCHKSDPGSPRPSPGNSGYGSPSKGFDLALTTEPGLFDFNDGEAENSFSPHAFGEAVPPGLTPPSAENEASLVPPLPPEGDNGGSEVTDFRCSRPRYAQPGIARRKRWVRVKAEKMEREDFYGSLAETETEPADPEPASPSEEKVRLIPGGGVAEKLEADPKEEGLKGRGHVFDEPLDFYGASMEEFSGDKSDEPPHKPGEDSGGAADASELARQGMQEETSHSGFAAVVYKLYPCQCGKSFTHKSQRDRHMSMHLGLRPYGCAVCGKKFKMKHHLVGHMKIHTGVKPYECSICAKRFMWRDSFNRHVSSCVRAHQAKRSVAQQGIC
ncbi:zinc finger and BTB domain-containing protein 43-like [Conger conger]|uniref:zinc finger and BTB domain-containing protein 43-like n=1 Tax=Conger conger TaxID=82655 RepID=UPI002A5A4DD4|nr:zinc finger and BTB domain-containing protein 43-like [Conger conger]